MSAAVAAAVASSAASLAAINRNAETEARRRAADAKRRSEHPEIGLQEKLSAASNPTTPEALAQADSAAARSGARFVGALAGVGAGALSLLVIPSAPFVLPPLIGAVAGGVIGMAVFDPEADLKSRLERRRSERSAAVSALCDAPPTPPGSDKISDWAAKRSAVCSARETEADPRPLPKR